MASLNLFAVFEDMVSFTSLSCFLNLLKRKKSDKIAINVVAIVVRISHALLLSIKYSQRPVTKFEFNMVSI